MPISLKAGRKTRGDNYQLNGTIPRRKIGEDVGLNGASLLVGTPISFLWDGLNVRASRLNVRIDPCFSEYTYQPRAIIVICM
jgi:hypothetical protein